MLVMTAPTLARQIGDILSRLDVARLQAIQEGRLTLATALQRASVAARVALLDAVGEYRFPGDAEQEPVERIEPIEEPDQGEDE